MASCLLGVFGKIKPSDKLQEPEEATRNALDSSLSATVTLASVQSISEPRR